ncbi:E3 ubiquitin-protein ligase [Dirofilaria immitis]
MEDRTIIIGCFVCQINESSSPSLSPLLLLSSSRFPNLPLSSLSSSSVPCSSDNHLFRANDQFFFASRSINKKLPLLIYHSIKHNAGFRKSKNKYGPSSDKVHRNIRKRRTIDQDCSAGLCCLKSIYFDFHEHGMDNIVRPSGFNMNFCDGECSIEIETSDRDALILQDRINHPESPFRRRLSCCVPIRWSSVEIVENRNVFDELLKEPYREERRIQLGRSKFVDIFFYSGVYDYRWLRIFINFPIGFLIAFLLYEFAWHQINFADFDRIAEQILKWSLIIASSITFAISPLFRCAIICVLFGALGKNGQNLLTVVVFNSLSSGPIENILQNFKVSTNMITCHIKQKEDMMTQRVVMATGPVEAFMAREFGKSTSKGRKVIAMLKSLVEPLEYDFTLSDEDKALAATIDAAEVLHTRDSLLNKEPENSKEGLGIKTQKSVVPTWNKLKSNLSKLLSIRMHYQCNEVFDKGVKKCHDAFRDMKNKCYSILWFLPLFRGRICDKFDTLQICQVSKKVTEALTFCNQMTNQVLSRTKNLDSDLTDAHNLTEDILDHLRVNMHYRAIVEPRNVRIYGIKEVKYRIAQNFRLLKIILITFKQILACLFVTMIYTIFRDSVKMIRNYLNDIDFDNIYLTSYFWHIDCKREQEGKIFLYPLSKAEIHANNLMTPISPPTKAEIRASWLPLAKFTFIFVISLFVVFVDFIFYKVIYNIEGTGFVADLVKEMLEFDYKSHRNLTISLEKCIYNPVSPDWSYVGKYILFPLGIMFILQVIFGYVIKRVTLFCVIGNIFRKRNKARIIHLYNKMLFVRINGRKLARARIRFQVQRRILQREELQKKSKLFADTIIEKILDFLFKTGMCLMCEEKYRKRNLIICSSCPAVYCSICYQENYKICYACLAKEGKVSSSRTTFFPADMQNTETSEASSSK